MILQHQIKTMKTVMVLFAMMLLISCQEEHIIITEPDKNTAFNTSDTLAELILRITLKDGSFDNIIDNCSAISIKFPYSVQIRNDIITITSPEDIENLEQEYSSLIASLRINYPVTVIFNDYSESLVSNKGDLQRIQNQCNAIIDEDDEDDEDNIECIDFVYPIELSLYNTEFQKPDFIIAGSDKDLHGILKNMDDLIVEISYPIAVETWDGRSINIRNNKELENEIINAMDNCDDEDDEDDEDDAELSDED